jgi:hypothetical protein
VRAALLLLLGCVATADAREPDAAPRFEARAVRVEAGVQREPAARFGVVARLRPVAAPESPGNAQRFLAHASVKAATATCRAAALPFADGFEG